MFVEWIYFLSRFTFSWEASLSFEIVSFLHRSVFIEFIASETHTHTEAESCGILSLDLKRKCT